MSIKCDRTLPSASWTKWNPADFTARLNGLLTPGATLFVTNEALYPQTTGPVVQVVDADPPTKRQPVHAHGS